MWAVLVLVLAVLVSGCGGAAPATPTPTPSGGATSLADLAVYPSADREQMLIEGARKEGKAVLYTSNSQIEGLMTDFQKKYPFIKVDAIRGQNTEIQQRLREEFRANTVQADVVESSGEGMGQMVPLDVFQEYFSPDLAAYDDSSITRGPGGNVLVLADREVYPGLAWNTNLISSAEAPKTFDDLLDPKWKGKMGVVSSSTGTNWIGLLINVKGEDYVKKMAQQQVKVQNITAAALTDLVVSGEVPMSPLIGYANVLQVQAKGAPVKWFALEPVITTIGSSALVKKAPHPSAALLLLDYIHSKEGQTAARDGQQISSPRTDVPTSGLPQFQKVVLSQKYSPDEYARRSADWEKLFRQVFLARS
jgi:iron(III) transport system substrate-binding protein